MSEEENFDFHQKAMTEGNDGWRPEGRMTTYAGTGIGLIDNVTSGEQTNNEFLSEAAETLEDRHGNTKIRLFMFRRHLCSYVIMSLPATGGEC